ncbi:hypothetical protein JQ617_01970 [Bradyrhizobium sp. KB893862 SZCCT0404]|uniref:hypothetical protein n=1 Tax=Bradyrhizobium sp. KB893862 SZCCT0404 TaxID=2807672 RepID=UPI001BAC1FDF|nr:hypothetical protein [Bradyrhizobium sp. KB893862 SZCCT0404]MBR1172710.1 hypothetical protein [Bradyrhizobium sp. KB893862 SZCCT0404]
MTRSPLIVEDDDVRPSIEIDLLDAPGGLILSAAAGTGEVLLSLNLAMCPDLSLLENVLVDLTLKRRSDWFSAFVPTQLWMRKQQK